MVTRELDRVRAEPVEPAARRSISGWLLAGWCALWVAWLAAARARLPLCPYGQFGCDQGGILSRWPAIGAAAVGLLGAVALLGLWRWDRRRAAPAAPDPVAVAPDRPTGPGRSRLRWLIAGSLLGVLGGAHLLLFAPAVDHPFCATTVRINQVMAYPLNCDSVKFLELAHHPREILQPLNPRQSRPAYVAAAAVATRVLGPAASALGLDRLYGESDTAYIPLVLINLLVAAASVALLAWLLTRIGTPPWPTAAICALLIINDLGKAFFWSPHQQMFAMLVPVVTIVIGRWLILSRPSWAPLAAVGFAVGAAALAYGSVLITVAVVSLILLARGWQGLWLTAVFVASFAVLPVGWIGICERVTGTYYNQESSVYHEFVWLVEAARAGQHTLRAWVETMSIVTMREVVSTAGLGLAVLACLAVAAVLLRTPLRPGTPQDRAILVAAALTCAASVAFGFGVGIVASRLMFPVVPGVLVGIAWLASRLSAHSRVTGRAVGAALSLVVLSVVAVALTVQGPYS